jgi:hypothetical protein
VRGSRSSRNIPRQLFAFPMCRLLRVSGLCYVEEANKINYHAIACLLRAHNFKDSCARRQAPHPKSKLSSSGGFSEWLIKMFA